MLEETFGAQETLIGRAGDAELQHLLKQLIALREEIVAESDHFSPYLLPIHSNYFQSARNLLHYLALRRRDLRPLQHHLAVLGFSSLGRAESHVLATLDSVLEILQRLTGQFCQVPVQDDPVLSFAHGEELLAQHAASLLGPVGCGRNVRIMVTLPTEAADNAFLVHELVRQGMDCMRINCAHDDPARWLRMIEHLRQAEQALGRSCRVVMDLAGPKLRTGPLEPGPAVLRLRPCRDVFGQITAPARVWFTSMEHPQNPPATADACIQVIGQWLSYLHLGKNISFVDARKAKRTLTVVDVSAGGCWAEASHSAYLVPETVLCLEHGKKQEVGALAAIENALFLQQEDHLLLTRNLKPGRSAVRDSAGHLLTPAMIGCTLPEIFDQVKPGDPIWFDDGKIGGVIEKVDQEQVLVRITQTRPKGGKLRADKGINLPESSLRLSALTPKDLEDLAFVAQQADVVELSFANNAEDVAHLREELLRLGPCQPALVLKIETKRGFENLPAILLAAMQWPCCGVMIARGDLAIECGFERLAEVQEEILWICEAAHVPVIWATQVLEALAKNGMPSRAEISDAVMGDRAECVMLNKGPHVLSAVRTLDSILRRMHSHQSKKRAMLRELRLAHGLSLTV
jgi:pyruvate kinase